MVALDEIPARPKVENDGQEIVSADNFDGVKSPSVFRAAFIQKPVVGLE